MPWFVDNAGPVWSCCNNYSWCGLMITVVASYLGNSILKPFTLLLALTYFLLLFLSDPGLRENDCCRWLVWGWAHTRSVLCVLGQLWLCTHRYSFREGFSDLGWETLVWRTQFAALSSSLPETFPHLSLCPCTYIVHLHRCFQYQPLVRHLCRKGIEFNSEGSSITLF